MHKLLHCHCGDTWRNPAYALLRFVIGLIFFYHGYVKVFSMGMAGTTGFFESIGIPAAGLMAILVAYGELLGGLAMMVGFLTHWVAKANILIMLGAIWFVHLGNGFNAGDGGYEFQLLLLVANIYLLTVGSGAYSVDSKILNNHAHDAGAV